MKQLTTLLIAFVFFSLKVWAQCTPPAATGSPYVSPPTDSLACIEQGIAYSQTIIFEMPQAQPPVLTSGTMRFDSILNIPCGIGWQPNNANATYNFGQTGCFTVAGTSTDNIGQYLLDIYITVSVQTLFGPQTWSGRAEDVIGDIETLVGPTGINLEYYLRVIPVGGTCPDIDTTNSNNLTAQAVCPPFNVTITGDNEACDGDSVTLYANYGLAITPVSILWSNGATADSIRVAAPASVNVRVIDATPDTSTATYVVSALPLPVASFTYIVTGGEVEVTNTSTGSPTTVSWDFDGMTHTGDTVSHTFTANGDYDITLITTNACGSDTTVETVTIAGVGINELGKTLSQVKVIPNPSNGIFNLNLVAKESSPVTVKVFNLQGQLVYANSFNVSAGQAANQSISLNGASSGIYILQVQANDALVTEKILVK